LFDPNKPHGGNSTLDDPNFIDNYFKNSRLHHIGAWVDEFTKIRPDLRKIKPRYSEADYAGGAQTVVLHIDMDCFFVSVGVRDKPELQGKPVAVSHASNYARGSPRKGIAKSGAEVSSCNYLARDKGVRATMRVGEAFRCCPDLTVIPYVFDQYMEVTKAIYGVFFSYSHRVECVSCDEAFVELPGHLDGVALANEIRARILTETKCPSSAGVGANKLTAKLATNRAKPDGCQALFMSDPEHVAYLDSLSVDKMHGIGRKSAQKLMQSEWQVTTVKEMKQLSVQDLHKVTGSKKERKKSASTSSADGSGTDQAQQWYDMIRGKDDSKLKLNPVRQSISVIISYGVRFTHWAQVAHFLDGVCAHIVQKMMRGRLRGRHIAMTVYQTLGVIDQKKKPDKKDHLGHGFCTRFSQSESLAKEDYVGYSARGKQGGDGRQNPTFALFLDKCVRLYKTTNVHATQCRGIEIRVSNMLGEHEVVPRRQMDLRKHFPAASDSTGSAPYEHKSSKNNSSGSGSGKHSSSSSSFMSSSSVGGDGGTFQHYSHLAFEDLDASMIAALPEELRRELAQHYMSQRNKQKAGRSPKGKKKRKKPGSNPVSRENSLDSFAGFHKVKKKKSVEGGEGAASLDTGRGESKGLEMGAQGREDEGFRFPFDVSMFNSLSPETRKEQMRRWSDSFFTPDGFAMSNSQYSAAQSSALSSSSAHIHAHSDAQMDTITSSQIDQTVLNELPLHMRQQVKLRARANDDSRRGAGKTQATLDGYVVSRAMQMSSDDESSSGSGSSSDEEECDQLRFTGKEAMQDLHREFGQWLAAIGVPMRRHTDYLCLIIKAQVRARNLDLVVALLRRLRRFALQQREDSGKQKQWETFLEQIMAETQRVTASHYGRHLTI
jgi:nucleotidyltransferase/DNA polymerase involved in DNA repair